jgi:AmiR/NasT family two-component response regulator
VSPSPYRVVIAEDEALIRLDLKEMLEEPGEGAYVVIGEASDGDTAVQLAADLKPDLVIMDIKMPVLDGISAAEQITARRLAPVVILTAFSQRDLVQRASSAGAMAYLVKPFTKAELIPAIEIAVSRFAELTALQSEIGDLKERLAMRKLLDRAKGVLQASQGMTEPEAFRWIQKTSMDRRMTMRALAQEILDGQPTAQAGAGAAAGPGGAAEPGTTGQGTAGHGAAGSGPSSGSAGSPGAEPESESPGTPGPAAGPPASPGPRPGGQRGPGPRGPRPAGSGTGSSGPDARTPGH